MELIRLVLDNFSLIFCNSHGIKKSAKLHHLRDIFFYKNNSTLNNIPEPVQFTTPRSQYTLQPPGVSTHYNTLESVHFTTPRSQYTLQPPGVSTQCTSP